MDNKWIYYDSIKNKTFEIPTFDLNVDNVNIHTPFMNLTHITITGREKIELTVDCTNFELGYVNELMHDNFSLDGQMKYKKDIMRTIILMCEDGRMIELNGCVFMSADYTDIDTMNFNKMTFSVDYRVEPIEGSDVYYETLRELRKIKLDNLLD